MWKEFRDFAMRGNVIDLAIGVIIGAAFGKIVTSLVNDVLMPPLGLLLGKVDFSSLFINLSSIKSGRQDGLMTARSPDGREIVIPCANAKSHPRDAAMQFSNPSPHKDFIYDNVTFARHCVAAMLATLSLPRAAMCNAGSGSPLSGSRICNSRIPSRRPAPARRVSA